VRWTSVLVALLAGCAAQSESPATLFAPARSSPVRVGDGPGPVALVDVNGDGHLDLVTKHLLGKCVKVLLGDGRGAFTSTTTSTLALDEPPGAMAVGDVDGDGRVDLAIARCDGTGESVDVLLGDRDGAFRRARGSPYAVQGSLGRYKPCLALADLNEDGRLDVVTANAARHSVEILLADAAGGFSSGGSVSLAREGIQSLTTFAVGDVDSDGHLDLVAATDEGPDSRRGRVQVRRGDGRGAFAAASPSVLSVAARPAIETLADVDGDRRPDVVIGHAERSLLSVLLNHGDGTFASAPGSPFDVGFPAFAVVAADVDDDGRSDLLAATVDSEAAPFESLVVVLRGDGRGFAPRIGFPAGVGAYRLAVGDVDEDGRLDVALACFESDGVVLLLGRRA
jgi:hypothetical protein